MGRDAHQALPFSPLAVVGQVLSKHMHGLELRRGGGLDLIQDHTILPLQSREACCQLGLLSPVGLTPQPQEHTRAF